MENRTFLATMRQGLSRAEFRDGSWHVASCLPGMQINCLVANHHNPRQVYAGTQRHGIQVSEDSGITWQPLGLEHVPVKSLAVSVHQPDLVYAGGKPVSLFISHDAGQNWAELPSLRSAKKWWWFSPADPPGWLPYVQALTISPSDPDVIMAGIEFGGVLRSDDGGQSWSKHRRGAILDCHSLTFHPTDGNWVYQGGAGLKSGAAFSRNAGITWQQPRDGLNGKYGWMVAADPVRPEVWYLSSGGQPNLLRGEFEPLAHVDGRANAHIYRSAGGAVWEQLSGGLPQPLDYMAYALVTDLAAPGHLYAGLSNGDIWHTVDYGDTWVQMPFNLGAVYRTLIII